MLSNTPARDYAPGMGQAVADRTITRKVTRHCVPYGHQAILPRRDDVALDDDVQSWCKSNGLVIDGYHVPHGDGLTVEVTLNVIGKIESETWADVADRVAHGNSEMLRKHFHNALVPHTSAYAAALVDQLTRPTIDAERTALHHHLRQASTLMSGRHLQHGDATQPTRPMEVFTNCSTSVTSFLTFYLLLNGSGVGRAYDDLMIQCDLRKLPITVCVCDGAHPDVQSREVNVLDLRGAKHLYAQSKVVVFNVPDSREGWAKAIEKMELMAFQGTHRKTVLLLDFSGVRQRGAPIAGMQGRPASGPGPLIAALQNVAKLRDAGMAPWRSAIYADHYLAECVLVGGARRAARMATKTWRDKNVLDFIAIKRGGFLWSSNNSVTVDAEFWDLVKEGRGAGTHTGASLALKNHAHAVFDAICAAAYHDGTGEPGLITVDKLTHSDEGIETLMDGKFADSARYKLEPETLELTRALARAWSRSQFKVITNPCGEIVLIMLGGYCVIADVVPFYAGSLHRDAKWSSPTDPEHRHLREWDNDAEDSFRATTRALIRTNLMDALYAKEVERTNRIGVGMTGIHEYAYARFGYGWKALVDEQASLPFWLMLSRFKRAVQSEAASYSKELGVAVPMTDTTMKPAGTTSKLFGLTEGAHLPSMREFLRWVQFRNGDPIIEEYRAKGYPVRELKIYSGTTIVGFPTRPTICELGMGDLLVTAAEATPEEQYRWLQLLEKYWITGVAQDGVTPLRETGNQVSYTLKYKPDLVSYDEFKRTLLDGQSSVRCCSVMPQTDTSAYEYLPETPVSKREYEAIANVIRDAGAIKEDVGMEHVDCGSGGCPISFGENETATS